MFVILPCGAHVSIRCLWKRPNHPLPTLATLAHLGHRPSPSLLEALRSLIGCRLLWSCGLVVLVGQESGALRLPPFPLVALDDIPCMVG